MKTFAGIACAVLVLSLAACKRDKPIDGIGDFRFGTSTLGDWGYACQPPEGGKTFCQNNPLEKSHHVSLGGQNAYAGALFNGTKDDAPLEELELFVETCNPESLRSWLQTTFGSETDKSDKAGFWKQEKVYVAAKLPPKGPSCVVKMFESKNTERIAKYEKWK